MALRKPTQLLRRTVTMTGRQVFAPGGELVGTTHTILGPEQGARPGDVRRVTVILPETPGVSIALGPQFPLNDGTDIEGIDNSGGTPEDIANSRGYQWAQPDAGRDYTVELMADQWISAKSEDGIAKVSLIVEYPA
jgi:hypothetical protein